MDQFFPLRFGRIRGFVSYDAWSQRCCLPAYSSCSGWCRTWWPASLIPPFSAHGYGCVGAWTLPVCGPSCSVVVFQRAARSTRNESFAFVQVECRRSVGNLGGGLSLSMGVCDASIPDLLWPEPRSFERVRGRSSHRHHHVAIIIPW